MNLKSVELDFYAPAPDHRKMNKERLGRLRDDMFRWRKNHGETCFDEKTGARKPHITGYEMEAKQVLIKGSQREAIALEEARKQRETIWHSAAGHPVDRRREWRVTGFQFDRDHFRTSSDPRSPFFSQNKPSPNSMTLGQKRAAIARDPYLPYYHDSITLCHPPKGREVTCFAVTYNLDEAQTREEEKSNELKRAKLLSTGHTAEPEAQNNWCAALGPAIASQQRAAELAEATFQDLVQRQSTLRGVEPTSIEATSLRLPTSEIAYSLRPSYAKSHQVSPSGTTIGTDGHLPSLAASEQLYGRRASTQDASTGDMESEEPEQPAPLAPTPPPAPAKKANPEGDDALGSGQLPAEAKETRLYAIRLRRQVTNKDTSMISRQDPHRHGDQVVLPETWLSPLTFK